MKNLWSDISKGYFVTLLMVLLCPMQQAHLPGPLTEQEFKVKQKADHTAEI